MCGIAGFIGPGTASELEAMLARVAHRGPDAEGFHFDGGLGFGHRRLSILDLSQAGHQPMHSDCGRFTVTFNGEIYNHLDIRAELEAAGVAPNWRGHSDTETLLCAVRHWGIEAALQRLAGMFALALWDAKEQTLTLARDRFGEKPLFYGWCGKDMVFASELKALAKHPAWSPSLDRAAMTAFMRYAYVPAPSTVVLASTTPIFAFLITWGITRHEPATLLKLAGAVLGLAGTVAIIGLDALGGLNADIFGTAIKEC